MLVREPPLWTASAWPLSKRGDRGYDAGKHTKGRKRHIVVDVLGLILEISVTGGDVQDRDGAYAGKLVEWAQESARLILDIVRKPKRQVGFGVLPWRWIVERTLAWLGNYRRLARDYEISARTRRERVKRGRFWRFINYIQ